MIPYNCTVTMKKDYLQQLRQFYSRYKRLPTFTETLGLFKFSSRGSVYDLFSKWVREGILQKENNRYSPTPHFFSLPFLGIIKAGIPAVPYEEVESLNLDEFLISNRTTTFLLKVSGDSMIEEHISDGDIAVVDKRRQPKDGDIVAACVDDEWTLKYYKKDLKGVYLMAANPNYRPIYPKQSLTIGGVVISVIRKYH